MLEVSTFLHIIKNFTFKPIALVNCVWKQLFNFNIMPLMSSQVVYVSWGTHPMISLQLHSAMVTKEKKHPYSLLPLFLLLFLFSLSGVPLPPNKMSYSCILASSCLYSVTAHFRSFLPLKLGWIQLSIYPPPLYFQNQLEET